MGKLDTDEGQNMIDGLRTMYLYDICLLFQNEPWKRFERVLLRFTWLTQGGSQNLLISRLT